MLTLNNCQALVFLAELSSLAFCVWCFTSCSCCFFPFLGGLETEIEIQEVAHTS